LNSPKEFEDEKSPQRPEELVIKLDTLARRKPPTILKDEDINEKLDLIEG
jgi:hypothetical protein